VPFLVRRARSSWLLLACVAVTVLLTTGLAAVLWTFAGAAIPPGARSILAAPQGRVMRLSGVADPGQAADDSRLIRTTLGKAWPGVGFQLESALWADPIQLSITSTGTFSTQIWPASLEGFSAHATLTAGRWPGPLGHGGPLPVALPDAAASRLHLTLGSVVRGTPEPSGALISMQVTGLYRASDPTSQYWALDRLSRSGITVDHYAFTTAGGSLPATTISYGPAVVNPAAFAGTLATSQASWMVLPQAASMSQGNVDALAANTSAAVSKLTVALPEGLKVTSGLPRLLDGIASTSTLARSLFTIAALELLLVAGAELILAARLLASLREEDSALLRARGATSWQVARPVLAEAVLLAAVASLAGVLAGTRLTGVLARLSSVHLAGYPDRGITLSWLSALAMLVVCVAVMAWPALRALTPDAARRRRGRPARVVLFAWAGGDLAVVALAAVSLWQLRGYSAVAHPATGSLGIDPVVAVAPALALAGVALVPLRGLPLLARMADRATDRERRLAPAMVSWQIARRPIRQAGPVLLVAVATATTTLALAGYASWRQSAADQATFAAGSDVRVDAATALSPAAVTAIERAPGVTAATPASLASIGNGGQLIALDASTAGRTILLRPDLSPLPLTTLWRRITPQRPFGLAIPGRPHRLEILASLRAGMGSGAGGTGKALGPARLMAWIQDSGGGIYHVPATAGMPADGRPHALVFKLSGLTSYPLRLFGISLTYSLPPYEPTHPTSAPDLGFTIKSVAAAQTARGPIGGPFRSGAALRAWQPNASSAYVPTGPGAGGEMPPSAGTPPSVQGWRGAARHGRQLTFNAGHDPSAKVMRGVGLGPRTATGEVTITAPPPSAVVPAIATSGYLAASRLHVGSLISVSVSGYSVTVRIVASVAHFPAVFGRNRALITDLAEVNDLLAVSEATPLPETRWWLRTARDRVPRLPARLGLSVTSRASRQALLLNNPLLKAPRQAMLAIGLAAVLLGVLGFSVSVVASLRSRRTQNAVFAALGVGKNAQAGQLCLEQCALSLPAAAAGLLAGIGLAQLVVPAITLTTDAASPVPSALTIVPLSAAVVLALITAAGPAVVAALSVLRRPDPAAQLRAEAR